MVCLSYSEPGGFTNARYLVRRLRRKLTRAKILVGFCALTEEDAIRRDALKETGAELIVCEMLLTELSRVRGTPLVVSRHRPCKGPSARGVTAAHRRR
jgi:hypothetical protein